VPNAPKVALRSGGQSARRRSPVAIARTLRAAVATPDRQRKGREAAALSPTRGGNRLTSVATPAHLGSEVTGHAPAQPVAGARARRGAPRVLVVGAPVVYVMALAVFVLSWGLPVARDQLFLWLLLGLAAFSVGAWRSWGAMLLAWLPWLGLLVVYDELRGAVSVLAADAHVAPQIAFDRWLGAGVTPTEWLQRELWSPSHLHWYDIAVWGVYLTHFFAVWVVAAMLWRRSRDRFGPYAVLTIVLTLAAFLVYWRFPAQPPWLASDLGHLGPVDRIVPLVWDRLGVSSMQSVYENSNLVNTVAAMPSLHAAYPFMLLLFFWPAGWRVRAALGAYTLAMAFALVYGGEHFVADIVAGWVLAGLAFAAVAAVRRAGARIAREMARTRRIAPPRDSGRPAVSERVV
jgi:membrane-associated phospholipid phosphatase